MKTLYIIAGFDDSTARGPYQKLAQKGREKGYAVELFDIDWSVPLSKQVFEVEEGSVIFGFSLGAVFAWLIAQKNRVDHILLASMTPHTSFTNTLIRQSLIDLLGEEFVADAVQSLGKEHQARKQTVLYGDGEGESADILVPNTGHELTDEYIDMVATLLSARE